jgi:hypothetical protein
MFALDNGCCECGHEGNAGFFIGKLAGKSFDTLFEK